jgi:hypothetical protein
LDEDRKEEFEFMDTNLDVVNALVSYVYKGDLSESTEIIDQLFVVAVNYRFYRLQVILGSVF